MLDAGPVHGLEQIERADGVVAEVLARVDHRLANERVGGEVDHALDRVPPEHVREAFRIGEAAALERSPLHRPVVPLAQVVEDRPAGGPRQRGALRCGCRCIRRRRSQESSSLLLRVGSSPPPAARHLGASSGRVESNRPDARRARGAALEHVARRGRSLRRTAARCPGPRPARRRRRAPPPFRRCRRR